MKMSKFLVLTAFVLGLTVTSQTAMAQIDVTINPIGALFGNLSVGADFTLKENFSIEGQLGIGGTTSGNFKYRQVPITAFGKYYFSPKNGADRFYGSVWTRFVNRSYDWDNSDATQTESDYSRTRVGLGFGLGYKVATDGGFVFDLGFGLGRSIIDNTSFSDDDLNSVSLDWTDLMVAGKLGIGYRFGR